MIMMGDKIIMNESMDYDTIWRDEDE